MQTLLIGAQIAALRKAKGITQEELARAVGVSTQAVSKWECGGTPDVELLPLIAQYFSVSVDRLFGRDPEEYGDLKAALAKRIAALPREERLREALEYCWALEKAFGGNTDPEPSLQNIYGEYKNGYVHSQIWYDSGLSLMSLSENLPYFMLLPEPQAGFRAELFSPAEYQRVFALLGDESALRSLFFLYGRDNKPFTPKLLEKTLDLSPEQAADVLERLEQYKLVRPSELELDDVRQTVYHFYPNPALIALLALAKEIIRRPQTFCSFYFDYKKPLL